MTHYRYPGEQLVLILTIGLVLAVIMVTAAATVCASVLFIGMFITLAYSTSRQHHQALIRRAHHVTAEREPQVAELVRQCEERLKPGRVQTFIAPSRELNAYTFGLSDPKVVVLYSGLFEVMDAGELRFIIGHELGHVALGHTELNSLVGGLAGIPSGGLAGSILMLAFLGWNRMCEFSADRAGLLACGDVEKATRALVKLVAGPSGHSEAALAHAYRQIDAQDDTFLGSLGETFSTHPMLIRRIQELRKFAASPLYRRLQGQTTRPGL